MKKLQTTQTDVDRRDLSGPFDIIGDVHGCNFELESLIQKLGYDLTSLNHPENRKLVFVGDISDRGPGIVECWRMVMMAVANGGLVVMGNHDIKVWKWLAGRDIKIGNGLSKTIEQIEAYEEKHYGFKNQLFNFISDIPIYYWLDKGNLAVAHAGILEEMLGKLNGKIESFALFGDTNGKKDDEGNPVRLDWGQKYTGNTAVVYGHVAREDAIWINNTIGIDTGCVFGGRLTAVQWPERSIVSVPAQQVWYERKRKD